MYNVQQYEYIEKEDEYKGVGEKVICLTLNQAKKLAMDSYNETGEYYRISKNDDDNFELWHDEIVETFND